MQVRVLSVDQVNEQANLYFKSVEKGLPDWDKFDNLLLQLAMLAMNGVKIESVIDRHKDILVHYQRRAKRREFASIKFIIYMQYATCVAKDMKMLEDLSRYGADTLYPRLMWQDKITILDIVAKMQPPYRQKYMDKFAIDFILASPNSLVSEMNLEQLIQVIALY